MACKNGYMAVKLSQQSADALTRHLRLIGIEDTIPPEEMHATLFYCADQDSMKAVETDPTRKYVSHITGADMMGDKDSEWRALALDLESPDLSERHAQIKELTGANHSYPDYRVHVSLKYKPTQRDHELLLAHGLPFNKLTFDREYQEDINQ